MQRRRGLVVAGMWIAALGVVALIYLGLEPEGDDGRTLDPGEAPLYQAGRDLAPRASRTHLPVSEDEGSTRLYRGGRRHTGRSPYRGPARASRSWTYTASGRITAQAVIGDEGTIFVGDQGRHLHAVSPAGERRWVARTGGPVWSAAAVRDDTVFVGSDADAFLALSTADGSTRWRIHTEGDADSSVSFAPDGTIHFAAGRDVYAVSPEGRVRWRFRGRGLFLLSTPAVDEDGTVYIGSIDDHLYAIAADGRMRWEHRSGADISSSPVIGDDGTVYFGSDDRHVHALTRDGEPRWRTHVDGYVRAPVALGRDGSVLVAVYGPQPRVLALDASSGELRWYFPVGTEVTAEAGVASGPLVDVDGTVYFGAHDDFVYSLTPDGRLRWIHRLGADIDAEPILTPEGVLIVGCDDGNLYAIADAQEDTADAGPSAAVAPAPAGPSTP